MSTNGLKERGATWFIELIRSLGFPIVVCGALMWVFYENQQLDRQRTNELQTYMMETMSIQLEKSTAALSAIASELKESSRSRDSLSRAIEALQRSQTRYEEMQQRKHN